MKAQRYLLLLVFLAGLRGFLACAHGQEAVDEYEAKAAFIYRLCHYVSWTKPNAALKPGELVITVVGKDPFGKLLDVIASEKKMNDKKIVVHRCAKPSECPPSHVVFIASEAAPGGKESPQDRLREVEKKTKGGGALLIGDTEGLALKGAMINLLIKGNRVIFEVNRKTLGDAHLQVSPNVLKLGIIVEGQADSKESGLPNQTQ
jgi:hypothetical protein